MIRQPAKLLDGVDVRVAPTNNLRNVAYEHKAVKEEKCAIGLRSDGSRTLLRRGSSSMALRLLQQFRQGYCPMIGHTFSSCDPVSLALRVMESGEIFISGFLTSGIEPQPRGLYTSPNHSTKLSSNLMTFDFQSQKSRYTYFSGFQKSTDEHQVL